MFELDAYLQRIGLSGPPSLEGVHLAHCTSIPFESLDPLTGVPVSLAPADVFDKLVRRSRGGYCFEQNLLLAGALRALGIDVELHLARVLLAAEPGVLRPRSHLALKVLVGGRALLADVGFGGGTLLEPLPWGPGGEHEQAGWRWRILEREGEHVLQALRDGRWTDLYAFLPRSVPAVDLEPASWWTSTHPDSRFVTGFLVGRQWADGRRLVLSDWGELGLTEASAASLTVTPVSREQIPGLLAERFELPGFSLTGDGRLTRRADRAR
jgi:N-hydroxyarylamine O-acetyltransferase